jgi:hypothetical protein
MHVFYIFVQGKAVTDFASCITPSGRELVGVVKRGGVVVRIKVVVRRAGWLAVKGGFAFHDVVVLVLFIVTACGSITVLL